MKQPRANRMKEKDVVLLKPPVLIVLKTEKEQLYFQKREKARLEQQKERQQIINVYDNESVIQCIHCHKYNAIILKETAKRAMDEGMVYDCLCRNKDCEKSFCLR